MAMACDSFKIIIFLFRFQFLLLENINFSFLKYSVMIDWEFGSLISEGNLTGCKIYRLIVSGSLSIGSFHFGSLTSHRPSGIQIFQCSCNKHAYSLAKLLPRTIDGKILNSSVNSEVPLLVSIQSKKTLIKKLLVFVVVSYQY